MFNVYIGIEGFTLPNRFIVKELTILFDNHEFNHFLFEKPINFQATKEERVSIKQTTSNHHGLNFTDGTTPYEKLDAILYRLHNCRVYCYGEHTKNLLQNYLPLTPVFNIHDAGFLMPETLPPSYCGRLHDGRTCSMSKALTVKSFFLK